MRSKLPAPAAAAKIRPRLVGIVFEAKRRVASVIFIINK
tara:strand:+ start:3010 stop:3126 length:117 start_codon:yes stop_codon:yes gene_type:complete